MLTIKKISLKGILGLMIALPIIPFLKESCKTSQRTELSSIMLFSSIEAIHDDGKFFSAIDSFYIHSYGQYIIYQIPEIFEYWKASADRNWNIRDQEYTGSAIRFNYCVFKMGDSTGLRFDTLGSNVSSKFKVDSLIEAKTAFKQGIVLDSYQLVEKISDSASHFFTEKYIPKAKRKTSPDSSFLYFRNDFKDVDFSFSKALDLQKKSKLYKFRIIFNPIPMGKFSFEVPRRELIFEIRKPVIKNSEQIVELFKKFGSTTK